MPESEIWILVPGLRDGIWNNPYYVTGYVSQNLRIKTESMDSHSPLCEAGNIVCHYLFVVFTDFSTTTH